MSIQATEELRNWSVDREKQQAGSANPPPFHFASSRQQSLPKVRREIGQTLHSNESPTFQASQAKPALVLQSPLLSRSSSVLIRPPMEVEIRPVLRPPTHHLLAMPTLKAIRSVSTLIPRDKDQSRDRKGKELVQFRLGRNVLNRLISNTGRLVKQDRDLFERKWRVKEARNWSKSRENLRLQDHLSFLHSLSTQSKLQKQHSTEQIEQQRFLSSQQLQNCRKFVLRKREIPKQILSIRNMGLPVGREETDRAIGEEEIRRMLHSRAKALFR